MGDTVEIARSLLDRLVAEADASGDEICGLLLGRDAARVGAAVSCANVHPTPATRFELDPRALLAAHRAARGGGARVLGHYHSHPSGMPVPSLTDAASAAPDGALWLIVADGQVRGWRAAHDGAVQGRFDPVELRVT